jgi:predicted Ser/Thr protein kinase/WD40 repeat protein
MIGESIGSYRITAKLGEGGMGKVYRATDSRLGREVAIKVAKEQFSERFEREAHAVAALNHPHICHLYDVGPNYLVMELVEGTPLKGPLPLEKAIEYAGQILDALDAAHKKGITHRDLKPANILVTKQGIKLLDFGLAKRTAPLKEADVTRALTGQGQILGTLQYMSPEQLQGKEVDARSDLFSFGCVLYEMLTGKRAFEGSNPASVVAAILEREPAPLEVARPLDRVVRRSLAKDPDLRFQTARDLKAALSWVLEQPAAMSASKLASKVPWALVGLATAAFIIAALGWWRATRPVNHPLVRLDVELGSDAAIADNVPVAIAPDGTRIVYGMRGPDGKERLVTRLLDQANASPLAGTEDGVDAFFSPDGQWVGFFADGKMKKVSVQGGSPVTICDAPSPHGASWGEDGNIVAALVATAGLARVSSAGGPPQALTRTGDKGELNHYWPQILPTGGAVLFSASTSGVAFEDASVEVFSTKTGEKKTLLSGGYFGRYFPTGAASGSLVYVHEGTLFGVPFDPVRLELKGTAAPLLEDVAGNPRTGAGRFDYSGLGTLIYESGKIASPRWTMAWLDGSGKTQPVPGLAPGFYTTPRISPDGERLTFRNGVGSSGAAKGDIFVYDLRRETLQRLTFTNQENFYPIWAPDGKHIAFRSPSPSGGSYIKWIRSDGAGEPSLLLETESIANPYSISPDGQRLAYRQQTDGNGVDLWTLPIDLKDPDHPKPGKAEAFLQTQSNEANGAFSPDGRWIAYQSDDTGKYEIYVRPFSGPRGGKWQISTGGGQLAIWSRNGRELFFETLDNHIMVVNYTTSGNSFTVVGKPHVWSDTQIGGVTGSSIQNYDLAQDGKHFVVFLREKAPVAQSGPLHVTFLLNFFDELRRRAPVGK